MELVKSWIRCTKPKSWCKTRSGGEVPTDQSKFVQLQRTLPQVKQTLSIIKMRTQFRRLGQPISYFPIPTELSQMSQVENFLAMHLALPYVTEPIFEEKHSDQLYPEYEGIVVAVGKDLLSVIQSTDLPTRLQQLREKLEDMFGFPFPKVAFTDDSALEPHAYTISIGGNIRQGLALHNKMIAISADGQFPSVQVSMHRSHFVIQMDSALFEQTAKQKGCVVLSPLGVMIAHLERTSTAVQKWLLSSDVFIN